MTGFPVYSRAVGITMRGVEEDLFLANDQDGSIYRLNVTGAAFWRALETPSDLNAVVEVFRHAFPEMSRDQIDSDLRALAEALEEEGLIFQTNG